MRARAIEEFQQRLRVARDLAPRDPGAAHGLCRALVRTHPRQAGALHLLALVCANRLELGKAASLLRRALQIECGHARWWGDLGVIYSAAEDWPAALHAFECSLELSPPGAELLANYARALAKCERLDEAILAAQAALTADLDSILAHRLLAEWHFRAGRFDQAQAHREAVVRRRPEDPAAWALMASAQWFRCEIAAALASFRQALKLNPSLHILHSVYLTKLLYDPVSSARAVVKEHRNWATIHSAKPRTCIGHPNDPDPDRRLRIGYLSGEFILSANLYFILPILEHHDRSAFETFLYHSGPVHDSATSRYQRVAGNWREVGGQSFEKIEELIRDDRIDILVDPSGHYPNHRLQVFASRPAPVQASIPNYPATTGLEAIDYIITDNRTSPPASDWMYVEKPVRLSGWYLPYRPPMSPRVSPLPAWRNGVVTFGVIQRLTKINSQVWDTVAMVMQRMPDSRLLLHCELRNLDDRSDQVSRRVLGELEARGVRPERVLLRGRRELKEHLKLLSEIDIALDTFPYNGQTTTCECLWMGVPVVTLTGESHVSRVSGTILHEIGLGDWVAASTEEYAEIAVRRARDIAALERLRRGLRGRMKSSRLRREAAVTRDIEAAYRWMWQEWCSSVKGGSTDGRAEILDTSRDWDCPNRQLR